MNNFLAKIKKIWSYLNSRCPFCNQVVVITYKNEYGHFEQCLKCYKYKKEIIHY